MATSRNDDTIVAPATPEGHSAIAMVRLSGGGAVEAVRTLFQGKDLRDQPSHSLHHGQLAKNKICLDDVVVGLFKAPNSYTGEDVVEISCHGSPYIVRTLLQWLNEMGVRNAQPGEFTQRAFLNGKMDLSQAEAVADLIRAEHQQAHEMAMKQQKGGISKAIQSVRQRCIQLASAFELQLDFAEEELPKQEKSTLLTLVQGIEQKLNELTQSFQTGQALRNGISIALVGEVNAGKSTLLNAFAKEEKALVSPHPGTTRDAIETLLLWDNLPVRLIDTAGMRKTHDPVERMGMARTQEKIKEAQWVIQLIDLTAHSALVLKEKLCNTKKNTFYVGNKTDKLSRDELKPFQQVKGLLLVSAKVESNLHILRQHIVKTLRQDINIPQKTLVYNARHYHQLCLAQQSFRTVKKSIGQDLSPELIAADIKEVLRHLGAIVGDIHHEDLLSHIFSHFCIGK